MGAKAATLGMSHNALYFGFLPLGNFSNLATPPLSGIPRIVNLATSPWSGVSSTRSVERAISRTWFLWCHPPRTSAKSTFFVSFFFTLQVVCVYPPRLFQAIIFFSPGSLWSPSRSCSSLLSFLVFLVCPLLFSGSRFSSFFLRQALSI